MNVRISESVARIIKEAHEDGSLPDSLLRWVGEEKIPSVRSCVKAPEGMVLTESDLKTAEMVALAKISGDVEFTRILEDPDPEWAVLKPGSPGPYTRVRYAPTSETGIPLERQNPDYIMTIWKDGVMVGRATEEMLERNADGSVKHRGYDIHWSVVERTYERPREELVDKIHRSAGKVLNFCCMGDAPVTTDGGVVPLVELSTGQRVWDGVEFVNHEGVTYQGIRGVFEYGGVRATPEHVVITEEYGPIPLVDAAVAGLRIVRSTTCDGGPAIVVAHGEVSREGRLPIDDRVRQLREAFSEVDAQLSARSVGGVSVLGEPEIREHVVSEKTGIQVSVDGAEMPHGYARILRELQRAWDRGQDVQRGVHPVGAGTLDRGGHRRDGLRQDGQRWTLRAGESAAGDPEAEYAEQKGQCHGVRARSGEDASQVSRDDIQGENHLEQVTEGDDRSGDTSGELTVSASELRDEGRALDDGTCQDIPEGQPTGHLYSDDREGSYTPGPMSNGVMGEALYQEDGIDRREDAGVPEGASGGSVCGRSIEETHQTRQDGPGDSGEARETHALKFVGIHPVYDIVNAGPRHRFTAYGRLVSNSSAYGASPASLERKIESDTGVKPEPGTGQKGLDAIAARQPRATRFLEEMAEIPLKGGHYRAASGRIRHCVVHRDDSDVSWRTRKSIESALGREYRNFAMQESVAATAARACKWALDTYKKLGLKSRPVACLYDSLVTIGPFEERFIVAKLHQVFLCDVNGWHYSDEYGERDLHYGIDTEFNERWSTNVKAYQKKMEDPEFHPTPEHLKWILDFASWDLLVT